MDKITFIKEINKLRKANKNKWYQFIGIVAGKEIKLKGYNTWLQVYKIDNIDYTSATTTTVKDYNILLLSPFTI